MNNRVAVYPGSFDPPTNGHVDIVRRALKVFDRVIVAVATNINKQPLFTKAERVEVIRECFRDEPAVEVDCFEGLLVDYMRRQGLTVVIRGLRAVSDFEYEFQMATMNRKLFPGFDMFYMMSGEEFFYVSSQVVREVAKLKGSVAEFVPPPVERRLREKFPG
jgi:pantetheine-phosphate adenylyltransferase